MSFLDLYLIRHGLAGQHGDYADDHERPLTNEGQRKTRQVAKQLVDLEIAVDLILTSPLVRARQTAEILRDAGFSKHLEIAASLAPGGEIQEWLNWWEGWRSPHKSLALVGHEPDLTAWAEMLIFGNVKGSLVLKKAGAIGLIVPQTGSAIGNSQLFWLTPPRLLIDK